MDEDSLRPPPMRLMNFVSEDQLDQAKKVRGERADDGTAQRDRPLFEILKENKDKRDAEFNERFKHRPPKALDEDETEFLDNLEMSRRNYELQMADEEAQQLKSFQAAVAAQSTIVPELKDTPPTSNVQRQKPGVRKNPPARPLAMIFKVKAQAKRPRLDATSSEESETLTTSIDTEKPLDQEKNSDGGPDRQSHDIPMTGLVSYSDESDEGD